MIDERLIEKGYPKPRNPQLPFCASPIVICNPKLPEYMLTHLGIHAIGVDGNEVLMMIPNYVKLQHSVKDKKRLLLKWLRVFVRKFQVSFFFDNYGEVIDSTMYVPCNHCLVCAERKQKRIISMSQMEAQQHDTLPLFITLTYDNDHLPMFNSLETDVVPGFIKRIRASLDKLGIEHNIRTLYCGEYGSKTQRPHYHVEMFGFPQSEFKNFNEVIDFIDSKWYEGNIYTEQCNDNQVGKYVSKYMMKSQAGLQEYNNRVKPFVRHSINMGVNFVSSVLNNVMDRTEGQFQTLYYRDKFTGSCNVLPFNSYYMNKLVPGMTQVNVDVRNGAIQYKALGYDVVLVDSVNPDFFPESQGADLESVFAYNKFIPRFDYSCNTMYRDRWYSGLKEQIPEKDPTEYEYFLAKRIAKEKNSEIF